MKIKKLLLAASCLVFFTYSTSSQVREDLVNDFTLLEQDTLSDLMQEYISSFIIRNHCDFMTLTNGTATSIHDDYNFLPFHRMYIEGMEDELFLKGYKKYVPLPSWDPLSLTPDSFRVVDGDCSNASQNCTDGVTGVPNTDCSTNINWSPNISKPSYLELPVQVGQINDLCDWNHSPTLPGQSDGNGLSRVIEGDGSPALLSTSPILEEFYHNNVHGTMGGAMGFYTSPAAPIFWNWHAYVDDIWKEWECNCPQSSTQDVDLYMKDNHKVMESWRDRGEEPSFDPDNLVYLSEDIWVKMDSTSGFSDDVHDDPVYDGGLSSNIAYVYVRIRNRGCVASLGTEELSLHWSKAFLAGVSWPNGWNGGLTQTTPQLLMGDLIDVKDIPIIPAGGQVIMRFEWEVPDPANYQSESTEPWHFCLLGRVIASNDSMAVAENSSVADNTINNNNIVWKNVSVLLMNEINSPTPGAVVAVGNIFSAAEEEAFVEFILDPQNANVFDVAEVSVVMDEELFNIWTNGGRTGEGIQLLSENDRSISILQDGAKLTNLTFGGYEWGTMKVVFNFLMEQYDGGEEYKLHLQQKNSVSGELSGGELFHVKYEAPRDYFEAMAVNSNLSISKTDTAELSAVSIGEPAVYEWYDSKGNKIGVGQDFKYVPIQSEKIKLRSIALKDGFVDYSMVEVDVIHNAIKNIAPNPASNQVKISYDAKNAKNAELHIQSAFASTNYTYNLNTSQNTIKINVSGFQQGIYTVLLIHDGVVVDNKQLSIF